MKLNPDCIRDLLMYFEKETDGMQCIRFDANDLCNTQLSQYTSEELYYHFKQCEYNGFLLNVTNFLDLTSILLDISPSAHEFLANIRSDSTWNKVKTTAKSIGSYSLKSLTQIASSIVTSLITQQLK